ncbi:hypothetical protein [Reinekea sp.]|jgi:hypothetical protein|uniref:hypothetical protein n=1 Tax=Reinekea sp. TaxID=1970455 RepID=UPI00398A245D
MTALKRILQISLTFTMMVSIVTAEEIKLENYGVYVKTDQGYIAADVYNHYRMDFEYYGELTVLTPSSDGLELIVYQPDILPNYINIETRPLASPGQTFRVSPQISPLSDDQTKITFKEAIPADRILLIDTGWGNNSLHAVALSSPLAGFIAGYKVGSDITATNATWSIEKVLTAYPGNPELLALLAHWTQKEIETKAREQYDWVIQAWDDYEKAETTETKLLELENVKGRIEYYFEEYPGGLDTAELKTLLRTVTDKLDF